MTHDKRSPRAPTVLLALLLGALVAVPVAAAEAVETPDTVNAVPFCEVQFPLVNGLIGCAIRLVCDYIIRCD
jgi:hypothetical protein